MTYALLKGQLIKLLTDFFAEDYRRIAHAIEVMQQAELLRHHYANVDVEVLLASALLHDVGIKPSEAELGYNDGTTQEAYGPAVAQTLLKRSISMQIKSGRLLKLSATITPVRVIHTWNWRFSNWRI
jgi:hypothetical protein